MRARVLERWVGWAAIGVLLGVGVYGCPGDTELATGESEGGGSSGSGGGDAGGSGDDGDSGNSGGGSGSSGGGSGRGGSGAAGGGSGTAGSGSSGAGGGDAGSGSGSDDGTCGPGTAIPAICQLCPDDTCGEPVCKGGQFTGEFRCANGGVGGSGSAGSGGADSGGCVHGGCSSQLCGEASDDPIASTCEWRDEYACYQAAECARQADGQCGFTESQELTDCLAGGGGGLQWYATCGDPVCSNLQQEDDPAVPNCSDAMAEGSACTDEGARCETLSCGVDHVCAATDPIGNFGCPISRARYKREVDYVDDAQLSRLHDEVTHLPLATWEYKHAPGVPQLGFIIEDIEPSAAATGDHVNVYGYLSMAVAAIQVQQRQIEALQAELSELREGPVDPAALVCSP